MLIAVLFATNCARTAKTKFAQNMEADAGKPALTYEEWVNHIGQEKTDQLYAGIGQDSLNLLQYGIGVSNMVSLIDQITQTPNLIALIGNDSIPGTGIGGSTGLGAPATVYLLKQVDYFMTQNISVNLPTGGAFPTNQNTVSKIASVVNNFATVPILQGKLIELMGTPGLNLPRVINTAPAQATVQKLAKIIAHVDSGLPSATKLNTVLTNLTAAEITGATGRMVPLINGVTSADKLVEIMETTSAADLVAVLNSTTGVQTASVSGKMVPIVNQVTDCTKMGYLITQVALAANLPTLISLIDNVQDPVRMGDLINKSEDGATWVGQVSPAETWGVPTKAAPFATVPTAATITGNVAGNILTAINVTVGGANYLPGISLTFPGCTTQPTVHLNVQGGVIQNTGNYVVSGGAGCTNGAAQPATIVTAGTTSGMARLVSLINGITPAATYYKLLALVDTVNDMDKMVRLVQDLQVAGDVTDLLNNMTGVVGATCTVANGTDTVSLVGGGASTAATATSFNVGNQVSYIKVTSGGVGYTGQPTITVPGCAGVTYSAVITAGAITQITVNNSINNMAQVVESLTIANLPRLRQVVDGQRIFDNVNEALQPNASLTTTYLGKLKVVMDNLNQASEGTLKVGELLQGVTNTDKVIDLIWGVTNTSNISAVINGIFKSSEVPGCSDGTAATYVGPSTVDATDTGTCENSGNGFFYGERDRAVTTLVYLVENVASSAKLISMIDDIPPVKVIDLINHISTYSQHADGTPHVYPRGGVGIDAQAAGKRLVKVVDNTTTISQLVYVTNNVSSIIKMSKLLSFMDIGVSATTGTGKIATLINAIAGINCYDSLTIPGRGNTTAVPPGGSAGCPAQSSQNATGMGKMVNVIEFVDGATASAAMVQLKNLLNNVTDIGKTADLINQTVNSSNIVGLLNGVIDARYGTSTNDLVTLLNNLPRGEISKMVSLVGEIGNATGTATRTFPGGDHVLIAQLMSPYSAATVTTTSGIGVQKMSELIGVLKMTGGENYTTAPAVGGLNAGGGTGATAVAIVPATLSPTPALGAITRVTLTNSGVCTVAPTAVTAVAGGGTGASFGVITAPIAGAATYKVTAVYIIDGGSTYAGTVNALTFNGTCGTPPAADTAVNGILSISVTNGGAGYTDSFTTNTFTGGGGTSATATALVAGTINTFSAFYGGTGYVTGEVCPIRGAGGSGGTCTVTEAGGVLTGCSAISGGTDYIDNQVVTIGGAAVLRADVVAGSVTGYTIISGGCGYSGAPTVVVATGALDCAVPPAAGTANVVGGVITGVTGGTGGSGCKDAPRVAVGESPYAAHSDGATAIIGNVTGGKVVAISLSPAADNLAQLLANTEKEPGQTAVNYNGTTQPTISAREAMVRLIHHGMDYASAAQTPNPFPYSGIGPVHIGQGILNNLTGTNSTMTVINTFNADSVSMTSLVVIIGCGDKVEYTPPAGRQSFFTGCTQLAIW